MRAHFDHCIVAAHNRCGVAFGSPVRLSDAPPDHAVLGTLAVVRQSSRAWRASAALKPAPRTNSLCRAREEDGRSCQALWENSSNPGHGYCGGNLVVPCRHDLRVFKRMSCAIASPPPTVEAQMPRLRCSRPAPGSVWNNQSPCRAASSCDEWECTCCSSARAWSTGVHSWSPGR